MNPAHAAQLDEQGFVLLERFLDSAKLDELRARVDELFEAEGENAGSEFKQEEQTRRLANLVDKGEIFRQSIAVPEVIELVAHVLGPEFKLSSLNVRPANPHSTWIQPLHADMAAIADDRGYWVCNTVWMLDAFTENNGALRVVPGSHRWGRLPDGSRTGELLVTAPAGTVVVMNAHLWHGGTANRTGQHRRAMHGFYCRNDKPQQQYQKRLLRPETQAALTPELRRILALDDPVNDELSSTGSGRSGFLK